MSKMGEIIKSLRIKHNMTQEELGAKLGVQKAAVGKWEKGGVENIKRSTIQKMSEIFNVTPTYLMGWEEQPEPPKFTVLARNFEKLDEKDKTVILKLIESMLDEENN